MELRIERADIDLKDILVFGSSLNDEEFIYFRHGWELPIEFVFSDGYSSAGKVSSQISSLEIVCFSGGMDGKYLRAIELGDQVLKRLLTKVIDKRAYLMVPEKYSICIDLESKARNHYSEINTGVKFNLSNSLKRIAISLAARGFDEKETPISFKRLTASSLSYGVRYCWRSGLVIILELDSSGAVYSTFFEPETHKMKKGKMREDKLKALGWSPAKAIGSLASSFAKAA